ncbi:hypothetical protein Y032_0014g2378 [Ancylostoma ceylanicum]|uniref:Peptidase A1 domain-containing protein n=1 Tax=Ancylostoma ceylanicum TaxID=53326 RepID=A0A016V9U0_9BILA|nr:hypothetical protein Y032_0014g2378 [Ancylostoma ceylanicum]
MLPFIILLVFSPISWAGVNRKSGNHPYGNYDFPPEAYAPSSSGKQADPVSSVDKILEEGLGPEIVPQKVEMGPGPVIPEKHVMEMGPGPVIPHQLPMEPGPVIPEKNRVEMGPGPVIPSRQPSMGPGPVIPPHHLSMGAGPVIPPHYVPLEPGPVIPEEHIVPMEPGPVNPFHHPSMGPGPELLPLPFMEEPGPVISPRSSPTNPYQEEPEMGPGPVIPQPIPEGPGPVVLPQGPGPVIVPPHMQMGPGPVIPQPVPEGPGPVILPPQHIQQGPGPVIVPPHMQMGPGPVITQPIPEGPGPVILPPQHFQQGPGPAIVPPSMQMGPGPVIPQPIPGGPGPAIPSHPIQQGPGPVMVPPHLQMGPGPVIFSQRAPRDLSPFMAGPEIPFLPEDSPFMSREDPTDGILGLAFTSLAVDRVVPPLINAINQNLLDQPLFTVWMEHRGKLEGAVGGVFTYGAVDTKNCGPVTAYEPLSSATYYQFKMAAIGMGSYTNSKVYQVISDTGTSFIGGPKTVTDALAKAAGAKYSAFQESYTIPCNAKPPTLDVTIGSHKYSIDPVNYIVSAGTNQCLFAIFPFEFGGFGPSWILGDPFIRQFCNIYDIGQKRMGFAPSLQNSNTDDERYDRDHESFAGSTPFILLLLLPLAFLME